MLVNISWDDMVQRKEIKVWLVFPISREKRRTSETIKKKQHRYVTLFDVNAKLARASFIFRVTLFSPNYVPFARHQAFLCLICLLKRDGVGLLNLAFTFTLDICNLLIKKVDVNIISTNASFWEI